MFPGLRPKGGLRIGRLGTSDRGIEEDDLVQVAYAALTRAAEKYAALSYSQPDPFQLNHNLNGSVGDRAQAEGYYGTVGEVIAVTPSPSAESIVQLWLGSPGHAAIILGGGFREIGVGCVSGPYRAADGAVWQIALCVAVTGG